MVEEWCVVKVGDVCDVMAGVEGFRCLAILHHSGLFWDLEEEEEWPSFIHELTLNITNPST